MTAAPSRGEMARRCRPRAASMLSAPSRRLSIQIQRSMLLVLLCAGPRGCEGGPQTARAMGWNPDMVVPPTPTPIKSGWWRRGRKDADDGSSDGDGSSALLQSENLDKIRCKTFGGGLIVMAVRLAQDRLKKSKASAEEHKLKHQHGG